MLLRQGRLRLARGEKVDSERERETLPVNLLVGRAPVIALWRPERILRQDKYGYASAMQRDASSENGRTRMPAVCESGSSTASMSLGNGGGCICEYE